MNGIADDTVLKGVNRKTMVSEGYIIKMIEKQKSLNHQAFLRGAEGEIRTLAPVTPVYSLSRGAPYSHLGTSAKL